jgi:hypothetical protein
MRGGEDVVDGPELLKMYLIALVSPENLRVRNIGLHQEYFLMGTTVVILAHLQHRARVGEFLLVQTFFYPPVLIWLPKALSFPAHVHAHVYVHIHLYPFCCDMPGHFGNKITRIHHFLPISPTRHAAQAEAWIDIKWGWGRR